MTDPVDPVGRVERRTGDRREDERRSGMARPQKALVATEPEFQPDQGEEGAGRPAAPAPADASPSAFEAQLIGQTGARRGLRGGPPVLDAARSTYLGTEYSGPNDRRPRPGGATRTKV